MTQFKNNPLTAHPLADQAEWWATDKSTKDIETIVNNKVVDPIYAPYPKPVKVEEGGQLVGSNNGTLSKAALRTKEGLINV